MPGDEQLQQLSITSITYQKWPTIKKSNRTYEKYRICLTLSWMISIVLRCLGTMFGNNCQLIHTCFTQCTSGFISLVQVEQRRPLGRGLGGLRHGVQPSGRFWVPFSVPGATARCWRVWPSCNLGQSWTTQASHIWWFCNFKALKLRSRAANQWHWCQQRSQDHSGQSKLAHTQHHTQARQPCICFRNFGINHGGHLQSKHGYVLKWCSRCWNIDSPLYVSYLLYVYRHFRAIYS